MNKAVHSDLFQKAVLYGPALLFPLVLIDIAFKLPVVSIKPLIALAIQNLLFFNTLHALITFYALFKFARFRRALAGAIETKKKRFIIVNVVVFILGIWAFVCWKRPDLVTFVFVDSQMAINFFLIFNTFLAIHHNVWQVRGIGATYGDVNTGISARTEKRIFSLLNITLLVMHGSVLALITLKDSKLWLYGPVLVATGLILVLMGANLQPSRRKKAVFYSRLLFLPLVYISPLAAFSIHCFHGLEYIAFFKNLKIPENNPTQSPLSKGAAIALAVMFLFLLTPYAHLVTGESQMGSPAFVVIAGVTYGFTYVHYYFDEHLFLFSNPKTRQEIVPILQQI